MSHLKSWGWENKAVAVLGDRVWPEHVRAEVYGVGEIFLTHVEQRTKER